MNILSIKKSIKWLIAFVIFSFLTVSCDMGVKNDRSTGKTSFKLGEPRGDRNGQEIDTVNLFRRNVSVVFQIFDFRR